MDCDLGELRLSIGHSILRGPEWIVTFDRCAGFRVPKGTIHLVPSWNLIPLARAGTFVGYTGWPSGDVVVVAGRVFQGLSLVVLELLVPEFH